MFKQITKPTSSKLSKLSKIAIILLGSCYLVSCYFCPVHAVTVAKDSKSFQVSESNSKKTSNTPEDKLLKLAMRALEKAKPHCKNHNIITIVDYSKNSFDPRLWVLDVQSKAIKLVTWVAHGKASGSKAQAERFSNIPKSHQSSLGVFVTGKTYQGKHGYSLDLHGLEPGINSNAHSRRIVVHSANYVQGLKAQQNKTPIGRSHGCLAVAPAVNKSLINLIKGGSLVFVYYPDAKWLSQSRFL